MPGVSQTVDVRAGVGFHGDHIVDDVEIGIVEVLPVGDAPGLVEEGELGTVLFQGHGEAVYVPLLYQLYSIKY